MVEPSNENNKIIGKPILKGMKNIMRYAKNDMIIVGPIMD